MARNLQEFREYRERMNRRILATESLGVKRFFNLDSAAYREGALPSRIKELLGLAASLVLRCNDCVGSRPPHPLADSASFRSSRASRRTLSTPAAGSEPASAGWVRSRALCSRAFPASRDNPR